MINKEIFNKIPDVEISYTDYNYTIVTVKDSMTRNKFRIDINMHKSPIATLMPDGNQHKSNNCRYFINTLLCDLNSMTKMEIENWIKNKEAIKKFNL